MDTSIAVGAVHMKNILGKIFLYTSDDDELRNNVLSGHA